MVLYINSVRVNFINYFSVLCLSAAKLGSRRRQVGVNFFTVLRETWGLFRIAWYLPILSAVTHRFPFCSSRPSTWWGAWMIIGCPKKTFQLPEKLAGGCHSSQAGWPPWTVRSSFFDKYMMGPVLSLSIGVRTPRACSAFHEHVIERL